jgi:hypothetical protein
MHPGFATLVSCHKDTPLLHCHMHVLSGLSDVLLYFLCLAGIPPIHTGGDQFLECYLAVQKQEELHNAAQEP